MDGVYTWYVKIVCDPTTNIEHRISCNRILMDDGLTFFFCDGMKGLREFKGLEFRLDYK